MGLFHVKYPLAELCKAHGLPVPVTEHRFHPVRKFRFDFAWLDSPVRTAPDWRLAIEVEGGAFIGGAHTRGGHFKSDLTKYELALNHRWIVYRILPEWVGKQSTLDTIRGLLT